MTPHRLLRSVPIAAAWWLAVALSCPHALTAGIDGPGQLAVRLCVSAPLAFPDPSYDVLARGIANAVTLATEEWSTRFRRENLALLPPIRLNEVPRDAGDALNAQTCARRMDTYGYIGPLFSTDALAGEPILNRAGLAQISGSNTSVALTDPRLRTTQEPSSARHRIPSLTYYRTITTDALEGASAVAYLKQRLHGGSYILVDDSLPYGVGLATTMRAHAAKLGLHLLGVGRITTTNSHTVRRTIAGIAALTAARQPDAVLYGGSAFFGRALPEALRRQGYSGPILGGDPIFTPSFPSTSGGIGRGIFALQPGIDPAAAAHPFRRAYQKRFHVPLLLYAPYAYDAANIALHALYESARLGRLRGTLLQRRASVLPFVARVHWYGATGVTTFDRNGDTRHRLMSVYRRTSAQWRYTGIAPAVQAPSTS